MKSFGRILGMIIAVILCLVTIGFQGLTYASFTASELLKDDSVTEIIGNMDFSDLLSSEELPSQDLYSALSTYGFNEAAVTNILNSAPMKEILAEIAVDYKNAVLNDETYKVLTQTQAATLVNEHIDSLLQEAGISGNDTVKTIASGVLETFAISVSQQLSQIPDFTANGRLFSVFEFEPAFWLSQTGRYILIGIDVVLFILIALLLASLGKGLKWYGVTTIITAACLLAGTAASSTALWKLLFTLPQAYTGILQPVFDSARPHLLLYGGIGIVGGALMTAIGSVLKKKKKKQKMTA
jgi:hypothetical protein